VVVADWDRHPARFALDLDIAGSRHRIDGARDAEGLFRVRYVTPSGDVARTWLHDDPPVLAPGPIPMPALDATALAGDVSGDMPSPAGGVPLKWTLGAPARSSVTIEGVVRSAVRRELTAGPASIVFFTEENGFPLRIDLPGGIVVELAEEDR
jgi:hypothetical protein